MYHEVPLALVAVKSKEAEILPLEDVERRIIASGNVFQ